MTPTTPDLRAAAKAVDDKWTGLGYVPDFLDRLRALRAALASPAPDVDVERLAEAIKAFGGRYPVLSSDPVYGDDPETGGRVLVDLGHETWWEHGRLAEAIAAEYARLAPAATEEEE